MTPDEAIQRIRAYDYAENAAEVLADEVERLRDLNAQASAGYNLLSEKATAAAVEIERLRAENAELVAAAGMQTREDAALRASLAESTRTANAQALELGWFKQAWAWVQDYALENHVDELPAAFADYLRDNPKPGAGT